MKYTWQALFHGFDNVTNLYFVAARKTDIIRVTEQILDAISSGDFEAYTYVFC